MVVVMLITTLELLLEFSLSIGIVDRFFVYSYGLYKLGMDDTV